MKDRFHPNGNKKGTILVLVLVILSTLSVFGGVLIVLSYNRGILSQLEIDSTKAFYLAEAGVSKSINEIKSQNDVGSDGLGTLVSFTFGDGSFSVWHDSATGEIRSQGNYNGVKRTILIKYAAN